MKNLFTSIILLASSAAFGQGTNGLVAWWKMNSNSADSSGNSHHGTVFNATQAVGRDGLPNTAYHFSGNNSYISVPYASGLNLVNYSICAIVKVDSFNSDVCEISQIMSRGSYNSTGSYDLELTDIGYNGCGTIDTNGFTFATVAGTNGATAAQWQNNPSIHTNGWHSVVITFDGSVYKTYTDGVYSSTVNTSSGIPLGTSAEGIYIARYAPGLQFPYPFFGYIDDLRIYDHVLTADDAATYDTTTTQSLTIMDAQTRNFKLIPNPCSDYINIESVKQLAGNMQISIYDAVGRLMISENKTENNPRVSVADLPNGMYFIKIKIGEYTATEKLLKE